MLAGLRIRLSRSRLPFRLSLVAYLRLAWIVMLLWSEFGSFYYSLLGCRWPDKYLKDSGAVTHVLLVTDPRVRHLPVVRRRWIDSWRQSVFHRTLQRNWKFAYDRSPDVVVFLGDMLAHGHHLDDDDEYRQYVKRFQSLLPVDGFVPTYYAPGNEDVGLRINVKAARAVRRRFVDNLGPLNQQFSLSGHNFVLLDAPGLVEEDHHRAEHGLDFLNLTASPGGALEFAQQLAKEGPRQPTILMTHIPLARPESASCGPLREHGTIRRGVGAGYQNTMGKRSTHFLLQDIHPIVVFSGDDRDYCDYTHRSDPTNSDGIREVTVKSFSPFRSIRHPGFHLLSLVDPLTTPRLGSPTFADTACFLPDYPGVYTSCYLPLAMGTLLILLVVRYRTKSHQPVRLPSYNTASPSDTDEGSERWPSGKKWHWSPQSELARHGSTYEPLPTSLRPVHSPMIGTTEPVLRFSLHSAPPLLPGFLTSPTRTANDSHYDMQQNDLTRPPVYSAEDDPDHDHMCPYTPSFPSSSTSISSPESQDGCAVDLSSAWLSESPTSYFSKPSSSSSPRWWKWSWSFVLRGRRRRMAVSLPVPWRMLSGDGAAEARRRASLSAFREADWAEKFGLTRQRVVMRRSSSEKASRWAKVVRGALVDFWQVSWPAVAMWLFLFYRDQR